MDSLAARMNGDLMKFPSLLRHNARLQMCKLNIITFMSVRAPTCSFLHFSGDMLGHSASKSCLPVWSKSFLSAWWRSCTRHHLHFPSDRVPCRCSVYSSVSQHVSWCFTHKVMIMWSQTGNKASKCLAAKLTNWCSSLHKPEAVISCEMNQKTSSSHNKGIIYH